MKWDFKIGLNLMLPLSLLEIKCFNSCAFASKKTPHTVTGFSDKSAAIWQAELLLSLECCFH